MTTNHRASRTAEFMALFRTVESARPPARRLFADSLARGFLGPGLRAVAGLARLPLVGRAVPWLIDRRWPGARTSGVARTRLIDDLVERVVAAGAGQLVILGAGFDCRAVRLPALARVRVFELDHPETLAVKRDRLRRQLGALPPHVTFVGIDFTRHRLEPALAAAGFDRERRALFVWEGVTNYLSEPAVDATLRFVATAAAGSELLVTYVHRGVLDGPGGFPGTRQLARTLRRAGEPWTFGFDPAELPGYLAARGLELVEDLGSVEYRARYLGTRGPHLRGYEFYRLARVRVTGPPRRTGGSAGPPGE